MTALLKADEIRWSIDEPEPAILSTATESVVGSPQGLTASRADLVTWWRWRYTTLEAELARTEDLLVRSLSEASGYRAVSQAALGALHEQAHQHDRLREQHRRLRDEYRDHRERAMAVTV